MTAVIKIDDQPIAATFFGEVNTLTDFITPSALEVQDLYHRLTEGIATNKERVLACWRWVAAEVKYVRFVKGKIWIDGKSSVQDDLWQTPSMIIATRIGNCLIEGTKILTIENGKYNIRRIEELSNFKNISVVSYNWEKGKVEFKPILNWFNNGTREVINARFNNGEIIGATPEHRFFHNGNEIKLETALSGHANLHNIRQILARPLWYRYEPTSHGAGIHPLPKHLMIEYKNPSYGRMDGYPDLGHLKLKEILGVTRAPVYDIEVSDNHNFMLANGTLVHNCANKSFLLTSLLRNELPSSEVYCVLGNLHNGKPGGHAWVQLGLDNEQYTMESTMPTAPPLIPISQAVRYEAVHFFNDESVYAVEGRTQLVPFTNCYSTWLSDYLNWAYIERQRRQ